jgi:enoyl-CoA hydratase/carnithine racemase
MSGVVVSIGNGVMRIAMNRPDKLNAFDAAIRNGMCDALSQAAANPDVRVIVISGNGRAFSAGADVAEIRGREQTGIDVDGEFYRLFRLVHESPKPVIARWHGHVAGAALQISLLCDLRITSANARIGMTEINVGLPVLIGSKLLSAVIGDGAMRRMVLYADFLDGAEAHRLGLASEVHAEDALDGRIEEVAGRLAARNPEAVRITRLGWTEDTKGWFDQMFDQARRLGGRLKPQLPKHV